MKCPICSEEMFSQTMHFGTHIVPRECSKCPKCNRVLMIFNVTGQNDLFVWRDEQPPGMGFTEFVESKLDEHHRQKMH